MKLSPTQAFGILPATVENRLCRLDILPSLVISNARGGESRIWALDFDGHTPFGVLRAESTRVVGRRSGPGDNFGGWKQTEKNQISNLIVLCAGSVAHAHHGQRVEWQFAVVPSITASETRTPRTKVNLGGLTCAYVRYR